MYAIRPAVAADRAAVTALVVRLQADLEHHIGYHGTTVQEIEEELAGLRPQWPHGAVVAVDEDDVVRAVLTVEADREVGRAWLHGPFVDIPEGHPAPRTAWHAVADDLFDASAEHFGALDLELFGHRRNSRLCDFAARHGFVAQTTSRTFTLTGAALRAVLVAEVGPDGGPRKLGTDPRVRAEVADLHERSFPNRSVTPRQLIDGERGHTVVALVGADGLIGYAAGFAQAEELYVDYVAVEPGMRAAGAGRSLVRALLRTLAAEVGVREQAAAVINLGNDASERMFTALGFELFLELVPYRRNQPGPIQ